MADEDAVDAVDAFDAFDAFARGLMPGRHLVGWLFGSGLWATHDGDRSWSACPSPAASTGWKWRQARCGRWSTSATHTNICGARPSAVTTGAGSPTWT